MKKKLDVFCPFCSNGCKIGLFIFNRCNIPKITYFNIKVKKNPTIPMLNVDYMVINELTKFS